MTDLFHINRESVRFYFFFFKISHVLKWNSEKEKKSGKGFKINLSYEIRLYLEMLCFQKGASLWELQLVIWYITGKLEMSSCARSAPRLSAEDGRGPQAKIQPEGSKERAGATPGGRRVQYLQSVWELWVHLSPKAGCSLERCPMSHHSPFFAAHPCLPSYSSFSQGTTWNSPTGRGCTWELPRHAERGHGLPLITYSPGLGSDSSKAAPYWGQQSCMLYEYADTYSL